MNYEICFISKLSFFPYSVLMVKYIYIWFGYLRRVNQSGACSSSDVITSGGRKSEKNNGGQINRGCMWVPGAVRYYFILL